MFLTITCVLLISIQKSFFKISFDKLSFQRWLQKKLKIFIFSCSYIQNHIKWTVYGRRRDWIWISSGEYIKFQLKNLSAGNAVIKISYALLNCLIKYFQTLPFVYKVRKFEENECKRLEIAFFKECPCEMVNPKTKFVRCNRWGIKSTSICEIIFTVNRNLSDVDTKQILFR